MDPLIPGLIDDLGRECLIRVPLLSLPTAISVSKSWNSQITLPEFLRLRKISGLTRPVLVLSQTTSHDPVHNPGKQNPSRPAYHLVLLDPGNNTWAHLPEIPGLHEGLPVFCGVVSVGSDLVVMGGWDPVTCRASCCVYVYSFLSGKWRRGADMPGVRRSFFGCGSDHDRTVLVAGGHDEDKNALKSAYLYHVGKNTWVPLDDMEKERDECKVIFHRGRFHVISGYPTEAQGCFDRTTEALNPATWQWAPVVDNFLEATATPGSCVAGSDGRVYECVGRRSADVAVQQGDRWQVVAKVPADVRSSHWVTACGDKLVVIGCPKFGEPNKGYMLDMKDYKWTNINVPEEYSGLVQSGCVVEI